MFNRKTLFVIGAGAGHDIGMPVGRQLAEDIQNRTRVSLDQGRLNWIANDEDLAFSFFERNDIRANEYHAAFQLICDGVLLANSIDDFLNIHEGSPAVVTVGKAAIVRAILQAERRTNLYVNPSSNHTLGIGNIRDTWFVKFMQVLGPGRKTSEVDNVLRDVSFINFNYDRCLEHFLIHALRLLYGIQRQQASDIVSKANIMHPYGSVGSLEKMPFGGSDHTRLDYRELSKAIKTYTERIEEQDLLQKMHATIDSAECVVFLGFAYHKQNMALLRPAKFRKGKQIYGTALGMSTSDAGEVISELRQFFPSDEPEYMPGMEALKVPAMKRHHNVRIDVNLDCSELFDFYAKSLAG